LIAAASWAERPGWTIAGDAVDFEGACLVEMTTRLAGWLAVISLTGTEWRERIERHQLRNL